MSSKNKKVLFLATLVICMVVIFMLSSHPVMAGDANGSALNPLNWWAKIKSGTASLAGDAFGVVIKSILYAFIQLAALVVGAAGVLFDYIIQPANFNYLLNNDAVKEMWGVVRDFLNITFIFVLLYAAFKTILQIDDSGALRKTVLMVILMALLVNFSYPISRFIIDLGNITMYFFLESMVSGSSNGMGMSATFGKYSGIAKLLTPSLSDDAFLLIADLFFLVIFAITLVMMACLMIVRFVALVIIVIMSPIGFVGNIYPATKSYAAQWWQALFKYTFFAPIMIFFMLMALKFLQILDMQGENRQFLQGMSAGTSQEASFIAQAAIYPIPIIMMWAGMMVAQKFSLVGANIVTSKGQNATKWFAGNFTGKTGLGKVAVRKLDTATANTKGLRYFNPNVWKTTFSQMDKEAEEKRSKAVNTAATDHLRPGLKMAGEMAKGAVPVAASKVWGKWKTHASGRWVDGKVASAKAAWSGVRAGANGAISGAKARVGNLPGIKQANQYWDALKGRAQEKSMDYSKTQARIKQMSKELDDTIDNVDEMGKKVKKAIAAGNKHEVMAAMDAAARNGNLEQIMKASGMVGANDTPAAMRQKINDELKRSGLQSDELRLRYMSDLGNTAAKNGNYAMAGMAKKNAAGKYELTDTAEHARLAAKAYHDASPKERAKKLKAESFRSEGASGPDLVQQEIMRQVDNNDVTNRGEIAGEVIEALKNNRGGTLHANVNINTLTT